MNWQLPIMGFVVGILVGLTGMGGGVIMTPLLMLSLGMPPVHAVGTDLTYAAITKLTGAWQHWRQGSVNLSVVRDLATGSLPATLAAVGLLTWLHGNNTELINLWLERVIGVALIMAAFLILRKALSSGQPISSAVSRYRRKSIVAIGAVGGFLVGVTSVGSGSLILALLVLVTSLSAETLVGTDVAHAFFLVSVAALSHIVFGEVDVLVVGQLLIGSIPGVLMGSRLTTKVPQKALQLGLAAILALSAVQLFMKIVK